jgi:hypothetical protein
MNYRKLNGLALRIIIKSKIFFNENLDEIE